MCNHPIIPYFLGVMESISAFSLYLDRSFYGPPILKKHMDRIIMKIPYQGESIGISENIYTFLRDLLKKRRRMKVVQILSLFPCYLGGYPSLQLSDLIMRGFPDPVTARLWELRLILNSEMDPLIKSCVQRMMSPRLSPYINPELLCQDPTGLNLLKGSRPKDKIKRFVLDFLTHYPKIKNQEFLNFLELALLDQQPLAEALFKTVPYHPRVMSEIFNSSIAGRASSCIRKVDKTPVLLNLMCKNHD